MMKISYLVLGPFMTNTYIVWEEGDSQAIVIDPSFSPEHVLEALGKLNLSLDKIFLTHGHVDHMAGLNFLRQKYPEAKVYMHEKDLPLLKNASLNLSNMLSEPVFCDKPDILAKAGDHITEGSLDFVVLETPGHTPGSISFYEEKESVVFTGDTLFQGSIGRTDFPGGSMMVLMNSIREKLFVLPDSVHVLSGHGSITTIGIEKRSNPFLIGV